MVPISISVPVVVSVLVVISAPVVVSVPVTVSVLVVVSVSVVFSGNSQAIFSSYDNHSVFATVLFCKENMSLQYIMFETL